ncbi:hypothetical protein Emin_1213 [Elusimicrobium minutum Pei191]|uniref:FlgD/Vpr Ig-like domain-containing protein n=1 Tax=Elusimicrobium minutum (strain Pei191) TaxID=445932 RepID=B2KE17_ELUMP|nr:FlgD immunoglobulin-like domain containing protein [Elusimicrobium minutum]ACC98763.1 hypothetical protein Emin_1213 [Elusimicrobium minutum Pei191]
MNSKKQNNYSTLFSGKKILIKIIFSLIFTTIFSAAATAQTAQISKVFTAYPTTGLTSPIYCDSQIPGQEVSFITTNSINPVGVIDPTINSALIEFDKPFNWTSASAASGTPLWSAGYRYPNHCLQLCVTVQCSTISDNVSPTPSYPIQTVRFEIFKFLEQSNPEDDKATPAIRTINLYPTGGVYRCGGYKINDPNSTNIYCDTGAGTPPALQTSCPHGAQVTASTTINDADNVLRFCAAWDGAYNFDSEFAKTNGTFGVRARIQTTFQPPVTISETPIEIDHVAVYPGQNQQPILIDVTNVHSVRTTATVVGNIEAVATEPYKIKYRLSKDANVTMRIFDSSATTPVDTSSTTALRRTLINDEPRLGEGSPDGGQLPNNPEVTATVEEEPFDGRDNTGRLLPPGNYLVAIKAQKSDEWGNDVSGEKTYDLTLDPLKLTDRVITGLNQMSTAYASISYLLTEAATVYFQVYTPGTTVSNVYIDTNPTTGAVAPTAAGTKPTVTGGVLVYENIEQKGKRNTVNTKWDGTCGMAGGCAFPTAIGGGAYDLGQYLPDGNYVYVIWAEIPYTGDTYTNAAGNVFYAVKTRMYHNGIIPIDRGNVDITIQPVKYSTMGSSPIAYGLDPFEFNYSISREAPTTVVVKNTANVVVKTIIKDQVQVAQQMNQFKWDGLDDYGRYPSPGTYSLEVTTRDPIFPDKVYSQTALFPIDIFRVVDVADTPLLGETNAFATLSYSLTKTQNVDIYIYDKSVSIPNDITATWPPVGLNLVTGEYNGNMPLKSYRGVKAGEGLTNTETWDGTNQADASPVADGQYPYIIIASSTAPGSIYYDGAFPVVSMSPQNPFVAGSSVGGYGSIYSSDRVTGFINVTRGGVYFVPASIKISGSTPKLYHSTEVVNNVPSYTIEFTVSRTAQVDIDILSRDGKDCYGNPIASNVSQPVCRTIKDSGFNQFGLQNIFEGNKAARVFWDGKDNFGNYVASGAYTVRLRANGYPLEVSNPSFVGSETYCYESPSIIGHRRCTTAELATPAGLCSDGSAAQVSGTAPNRILVCPSAYEATETRLLNANLFQIFDIYVEDIAERQQVGLFAYQTSVPMKVGIQIFKPGTYIKDYSTGEVANGSFVNSSCYENPAQGSPVCTPAQLLAPSSFCTASGTFASIEGSAPNRRITCSTSSSSSEKDLLVKAIVGMRPNLLSIEDVWDGKDFAMQDVPDGLYPFRFVSVTQGNTNHMDSFYGTIDDIRNIADWEKYANMQPTEFTVARGDGKFVCSDWEKSVIFFPNPMRSNKAYFEVTKIPVPGDMSVKIYNIAGDQIRTQNYSCVDNNNNTVTMGSSLRIQPDNGAQGGTAPTGDFTNLRNAELRCEWDKKNDHGRTVARGVYFGLVEFKATGGGKEHCQRVVKILIP